MPLSRKRLLGNLCKGVAAGALATMLSAAIFPHEMAGPMVRIQAVLLVLGTLAGLLYIALSPQQHTRFREWAIAAYADLTMEQKLYLRVCLLGVCAILITLTRAGPWMKELLVLVLVFAGYVALRDALRWYQLVTEHLLGKAALALGFAIASAFAAGLAGQKIAQIIHVTPTNFTRTNLLIAIMMIPFLITIAGAFAAAVGIAISSMLMLPFMFSNFDKIQNWLFAGALTPSRLRFAFATRLFQLVFYTSIGMGLYAFGRQGLNWYETLISSQIPSFAYELDMYHGSECKIPADFKLAPLGDSKFLVAQRRPSGDISFLPPMKCDD